jgi:hypothetical protein
MKHVASMATVVALLLTVSNATAQSTRAGSVSGYVTDQDGNALPTANVGARGLEESGDYQITTDDDGYYELSFRRPGAYAITAEHAGFAAIRREVIVREGLNLRLDIRLAIGAVNETVIVAAETPLLESRNVAHAVNVDGGLPRRLPLSPLRNWADFLSLTTGTVTTQARFQTYSLHGSLPASGVFLVDGADVSSVLQGSTLYAQFAGDTFADIHVQTAAIDASSPLGLGPVARIVTRSGTNRRHVTAGIALQARRWNWENAADGQSITTRVVQPEMSYGGPLQLDHWWSFASLRVSDNRTGVPRSPAQLSSLRTIAPTLATFDNGWQGWVGFAKLTGASTQRHTVVGSVQRDVMTLGGAQPNEADQFRDIVVGGPAALARVDSAWTGRLLSSVAASYNAKRQSNRNRQPDATAETVYRSIFTSGGRVIGADLLGTLRASPTPSIEFPVAMWSISADLAWHGSGPAGWHDVQAGTYLQPARRNRWRTSYNNDGYQIEDAVLRDITQPALGFVPFHRRIYDAPALTTLDVITRDNAVYVRDVWRPRPRLTAGAGVRIDSIRRIDRLFDVVTQQSTEVGPRVGLSYLLSADGRNILRAAWSRVHDNVSVNETAAGTQVAGFIDAYDADADGRFEATFVTPGRTMVSTNLVIDRERYHQPRTDEIFVDYRRQLPGGTTLGVSAVQREYRDRPALVETNGLYDGTRFVGYQDPDQNEVYRLTANIWNRPVATAIAVEAAKQRGRMTVIAAYTREWSRMKGTWQPHDPAALVQPEAFANRNGIGFVNGCTGVPCTDANSLAAVPGSGTWSSHLASAAATFDLPGSVILSTTYRFQAGPWSGPIFMRLAEPDARFGPPTVTLPNGRVVSNPLATPLRFAYPTRGDGQFRLPGIQVWNLRIGRAFLVNRHRMDVGADILNMTNHAGDQTVLFDANVRGSVFFGQGGARQFPRAVSVNAHYTF